MPVVNEIFSVEAIMEQLTINQVAHIAGRTRQQIYAWMDAGHIPSPDGYARIDGRMKAVWIGANVARVVALAKRRAAETEATQAAWRPGVAKSIAQK